MVAAAFALAGCGRARDDCGDFAATVRFDGVVYRGRALAEGRSVSVARAVGQGSGPCDPDVTVRAIAGVPPAVAVAVVAFGETKTDAVFLAPGFVPAMASHPLHREMFGVRRRWTLDLGDPCRRPIRIGGRIRPPIGSGRLLVGRRIVLFDGRTRYRGPRRAGLPYLTGGERVVVRGGACRGRRVVADVLSARR